MTFDRYAFARPILHALDPERAHELGLRALEAGLVPPLPAFRDPVLETTLFGRRLSHPIGLAAGFDKNGRVFDRMYGQGFSFVEVGGVTPLAQIGNPRPRVFRLPRERAVVNRIGFANDGMEVVADRLARARGTGLLGVNLAANSESADPAEDFVTLARRFAPLADFLTLDISCPNTTNGRIFLERGPLTDLLVRLDASFARGAVPRPKLVAKLAPDLDDAALGEVLSVLRHGAIDALVVSNTTMMRPPGLRGRARAERGGLSGPPLFAASTRMLADVRATVGRAMPIVGVGGIASGSDAYEKIRAGASALQLYTALVYGGPALVRTIARDLATRLRADGFERVADAVGVGPIAR